MSIRAGRRPARCDATCDNDPSDNYARDNEPGDNYASGNDPGEIGARHLASRDVCARDKNPREPSPGDHGKSRRHGRPHV